MTPILRTAAAFLVIASGAIAQDAVTSEDVNQSADGNAQSPDELSLGTVEGEASAGSPEVGQTYVQSTHGDWQLRCVRTADDKDPCQLYQLLEDDQGNSVAEISVFPLPEGQEAAAGATVITPLETLLTADLRIAVDAAQPKRYPFAFCSAVGCFARIGFRADEVESFKRGAKGTVTIVPAAAPDATVALTLSLSGFTAGWDAVRQANESAAAN